MKKKLKDGWIGGEYWCEGKVTSINPTTDQIWVESEAFSTRDVAEDLRKMVRVGDVITLYFDTKNRYYAKRMCIVGKKDLVVIHKEQLAAMTAENRERLSKNLVDCIGHAVNLWGTLATYDDTKKDIADVVNEVLLIADIMALHVDSCSTESVPAIEEKPK